MDNDLDKVDVFVYTPEEWQKMKEWESPFAETVIKEGEILYEKEQGRGRKMAGTG